MGEKLSRDEISKRLDITDPFLMIDEFEEVDAGKSARSIKYLGDQEWFFDCHLPKSQVMPATLQLEGMLQTLVLLIYSAADHGDEPAYITDMKVKQIAAAKPSQNINYEAELTSFRRGIAKGIVRGESDGKVICRGEFSYASPHLMALPSAK